MKRNLILITCFFTLVLCCKDTKQKIETKNNKTSIHTISNKILQVSIKTKGAELSSIKVDTTEYLWQGNPEFWNRQSPILFPIVGRLKDHEYNFNERTYKMMQHGFARDYDFKVVNKTKKSITFEQIASEVTKLIYPFDFVLQIKYTIHDKSLDVDYLVKNPSRIDDLYFSIGAHPAFNCPIEKNQKRNEYQLVFDKKISPKFQTNINGLYEGNTHDILKEKGVMNLPDTIFDNNSLALNPNVFSKVTFVHKPTNKKYLSVAFKDFPFLGIWSPNSTSPFVCIEPWYGIADRADHNKDLKQKEGIIKLESKKTFKSRFSIEIL